MIFSDSIPHASGPAIHRLVSVVLKRRKTMLAALSACLLLTTAAYMTTPAQYVSEAILALDVRKLQALPTESVVSPLPQESPVLRTELDIISSRMMAGKVLTRLDSLNFDADGRINPADQQPPMAMIRSAPCPRNRTRTAIAAGSTNCFPTSAW